MARRMTLRRSMTTVLALLMITPQVLLRPCCCLTKVSQAAAASEAAAQEASLPPCCRKRLQMAENPAVSEGYSSRPGSQPDGMHDSSRCGCQTAAIAARLNRAVFKPLVDTSVLERVRVTSDDVVSGLTLSIRMTSIAESPPRDGGLAHCIRVCSWQV